MSFISNNSNSTTSTQEADENYVFHENQQDTTSPIGSSFFVLDESEKTIGQRESLETQILSNPQKAKMVLDKYHGEMKGWCELVNLQPVNEGQYVQVSFGGVNKIFLLHEVAAAANGVYKLDQDSQFSHRCNQPKCKVPSHICIETAELNHRVRD